MDHRLTLRVADLGSAVRVLDLLRRLDVTIHRLSADGAADGLAVTAILETPHHVAPANLPVRLSGLAGVDDAAIAAAAGSPQRMTVRTV